MGNSSLVIRRLVSDVTVLGIDPGLAVTGYGVLRDGRYVAHGTISSTPKEPLSERIALIGRQFDRLLLKYRPDACAVETLFFKAVGARSVILAAQLRGGLFYILGRRRIPVTEITPATIKLTLTGNGRAAKSQMQYMARILLGLPRPIPDHAADALAAAYCLTKRRVVTSAIRRSPVVRRSSSVIRHRSSVVGS